MREEIQDVLVYLLPLDVFIFVRDALLCYEALLSYSGVFCLLSRVIVL